MKTFLALRAKSGSKKLRQPIFFLIWTPNV